MRDGRGPHPAIIFIDWGAKEECRVVKDEKGVCVTKDSTAPPRVRGRHGFGDLRGLKI